MKYEEPIMDAIKLCVEDIICTSQPLPTVPDGDGPDWDI